MLDNIKFSIVDIDIINRVLSHPDFIECRPITNNYRSFKHKNYGYKLTVSFRKALEKGNLVGYCHLEINISPHYHFNQYQHNGNDFTPQEAIKTVSEIIIYLGIRHNEYNELKVVNIEFGLNINPETDIKNLINGLYFYKKTPFKVGDFPYFKKTDATTFKQIKAYAKGLQFLEFPQYGVNLNTFRFEVKSKQSKNISKYGINTATDLLNIKTYNRLGQIIVDEWQQVLLINLDAEINQSSDLKKDEVLIIKNAKRFDFWNELINEKHRNTFGLNKEKYFNLLQRKNNLHTKVKGRIIDKLFEFSKCAYSTQRTPVNRGNLHFDKTIPTLINLEYAHFNRCLVTDLDISMQKKGSKYLCLGGLKYYKEKQPETYKKLTEKYLTEKQKRQNFERQNYFIAHNIRNAKTNLTHNVRYSRKRFEKRNYTPNQLQLPFS